MIALFLLACSTPEQALTVAAASSLTEAFEDLEVVFEAEHPGVDVQLVFAGSQTLATQIRHGLGADVYASADQPLVDRLVEEGLAEAPAPFATNRLVLVAPAGRPAADLATLGELGDLVVGMPSVPVGHYTATLLDAATREYGAAWREAVDAHIVSREPNTRRVLAKVALGEADGAVVYATDARIADVTSAPLPDALAPRARYLDARLHDGPLPRAWRALVRSPAGRQVLVDHGFSLP